MNPKRFDSIISRKAERLSFQRDWERQRNTAREFLCRFDEGFDTQLLADEVGMGKTYVAMSVIAARLLDARRTDARALLVTPSSAVLRAKWEQELRSFSASYVRNSERDGSRKLRPLIVRSYWELIACLHPYKNVTIGRLPEETVECILYSVFEWARRNRYVGSRTRFACLSEFDNTSRKALEFASRYSQAGWFSYLDELKASQDQMMCAHLDALVGLDYLAACSWFKTLFKTFAATQEAYVPNVLILAMSALDRPRTDQRETQRFATFALGVLMKGLHWETRNALLKTMRRANILVPNATPDMLNELASSDLYRTYDCVNEAREKNPQLHPPYQTARSSRVPRGTRFRHGAGIPTHHALRRGGHVARERCVHPLFGDACRSADAR